MYYLIQEINYFKSHKRQNNVYEIANKKKKCWRLNTKNKWRFKRQNLYMKLTPGNIVSKYKVKKLNFGD